MKWKEDILAQYQISLDSSIQSIENIAETFYEQDFVDRRAIVAIDAVFVSPNIVIYKNGKVKGVIDIDSINPEEAESVINSLDKFVHFIQNNIEKVVKYFFVLYLWILNKNHISIPYCIIPLSFGNSNNTILEIFDNVLDILSKSGVVIVGKAYDGDRA